MDKLVSCNPKLLHYLSIKAKPVSIILEKHAGDLVKKIDSPRRMIVGILKGSQRKYLRGLAHGMKPIVFIGKQGVGLSVISAVEEALNAHELIKLRFIDFKEKSQKEELSAKIEKETSSECVGIIGHQAIFYRRHKDPKKRKIEVS